MTDIELLDHFAAAALPAVIIACVNNLPDMPEGLSKDQTLEFFSGYAARCAYSHAQAMMTEQARLHRLNRVPNREV